MSLCDESVDSFTWISLASNGVISYPIEANKNYCINGSYFVQGDNLTIDAKFWMDLDENWTQLAHSENAKGVLGNYNSPKPISSLFSSKSQTIYAFPIEGEHQEHVTIKNLPFTLTKTSFISTKKSSSLSNELKVSIKSGSGGSITMTHIKVINTQGGKVSFTSSHDVPMNVQTETGTNTYKSDREVKGDFIIVEPDYQKYVESEITSGSFTKSLSTSYSMDLETSGDLKEFQYKLGSGNQVLNDSNLESYEESSSSWVFIVIIVIVVIIIVAIAVGFLVCWWRRRRSYDATSITSQLL